MKSMNKLVAGITLFAVVFLASCGAKELTPKDVAKEFLTALQSQNFDKAQEFATKESSQMLNMLKEASAKQDSAPTPKPFEIVRDSQVNENKVRVYFKSEGQDESYVNVKKVEVTPEGGGEAKSVWLVDYTKESFMEDINMDEMMGGAEEGEMMEGEDMGDGEGMDVEMENDAAIEETPASDADAEMKKVE